MSFSKIIGSFGLKVLMGRSLLLLSSGCLFVGFSLQGYRIAVCLGRLWLQEARRDEFRAYAVCRVKSSKTASLRPTSRQREAFVPVTFRGWEGNPARQAPRLQSHTGLVSVRGWRRRDTGRLRASGLRESLQTPSDRKISTDNRWFRSDFQGYAGLLLEASTLHRKRVDAHYSSLSCRGFSRL